MLHPQDKCDVRLSPGSDHLSSDVLLFIIVARHNARVIRVRIQLRGACIHVVKHNNDNWRFHRSWVRRHFSDQRKCRIKRLLYCVRSGG